MLSVVQSLTPIWPCDGSVKQGMIQSQKVSIVTCGENLLTRTFYVNGEFVAENEARISVLDRGFLFADAVYEVTSVLDGRLIDNTNHMTRLRRSLAELSMDSPGSDKEIVAIQEELVSRNNLNEGLVYLQISRGAADRDFAFPQNIEPSLVMFTQEKNLLTSPKAETGLSVITVDDIRWSRRDIKTVGLLAPVLAKQAAAAAGADDAWMVEDGYVTEGSSNNAYIIDENGVVMTRHLGNEILSGITREAVLKLSDVCQIQVVENPFTPEQAYQAKEAFITSASMFVMPVVSIDGHTIGDGKPGDVTKRLRDLYISIARERSDFSHVEA